MFPVAKPQHARSRYFASGISGVLLALAALLPGQAQQTALPANLQRISQAIDDSVLTTLKGNVHPLARAQNDFGAAAVSQPMHHMQLVLQRSPAQQAALDSYLVSLQVKGSPNYHKWLTPQQFGKIYGPADADMNKITDWLSGRGFNVDNVSKGRVTVDFSGSVAQVQSAFHTSIHSYRANGISFLANTRDPQIPTALSAVVSGIAHLNTVPMKAYNLRGVPGKIDTKNHRITAAPNLTLADSSGNNYLYAVAADAATIYDTPNQTLNANFTGSTSYDGTGATIGIAGQSSIDTSIIANYRSLFVGDTKTPIISNLDTVGDTGDDVEAYLDNEVAGALAPGATIHYYTNAAGNDGGVFVAAEQAIEDNTVDILNVSFGSCELANGNSGNTIIYNTWQQAAAQGITVVVSTGDSGSAGCDETTNGDGSTVTAAIGGLAVNALASTPYDIAVGGTDYDVLATSDFGNYVAISTQTSLYGSALGYIPEDTWNNSTINNGVVSANVEQAVGNQNISAGAGGQSNCSQLTSAGACAAGYAKPSWQTGTGVPNDNVRDLPDVSFLAGNAYYFATWGVCDSISYTSGGATVTNDCALDTSGNFDANIDGIGGTSASAPAFAGIMAMVVQKTGERQGAAAPILYSLFNSTPSIFNDVTTGNNSVACTAGTPSCAVTTGSNYFESGFNTFAGYDLATGLGSVDVTGLVNNWTSASGSLGVANVAATPSATTVTTAEPLTFTVAVTALAAGGGIPAGMVAATDGAYTSTATALSSGSATITIPANSLAVNAADTFTVTYTPASGSSFATASTFVVVTITGTTTPASFAFTPAPTAATVSAPGQPGTSTISITPTGYTGTINFTCVLASAPSGADTTYNPACTIPALKIAAAGVATTTATFVTTAPSSSALAYPASTHHWYTAAGGAALACVLFFGIPARRRSWRTMLGLFIFLVAMAGVGCGGGGGSSTPTNPGTTAGAYTFTVTGTDSATGSTVAPATATINVTVN